MYILKKCRIHINETLFAAEKSDKGENPRPEVGTQLAAVGLLIVIYIIFADGND